MESFVLDDFAVHFDSIDTLVFSDIYLGAISETYAYPEPVSLFD